MIKKTAKQIAQQVAKQVVQEPAEILKTAGKQIAGETEPQQDQQEKPQEQKPKEPTPEEKIRKAAQSQRLMRAYESEIEDIRKQELFGDLQKRISQGEDVALAEFSDLTFAQREVLEAQKQAVKIQREQAQTSRKETVPQIISKKGRKMFGKIGLKREQTKVEMRQPPSS